MPFILSDKPVVRRFAFSDGLVLAFRSMTKPEREVYDKKLALIAGTKNFAEKFVKFMETVAVRLLVEWDGVEDENGQAVELDEAAAKEFVAHHEAQKYWLPALSEILNPARKPEAVEAEEVDMSDDFLSDLSPSTVTAPKSSRKNRVG
jgi:hypothetical protein